ncbi:LysR family transcriptional regulator [Bradyrhizobium jicamae]|uniref:LysR family transcriptional regulator n=2 Tax=Bradyrhizobium jicamae TaxID=280332 RepID=A0ABS5FXU6_9BRAD|nr:LysR family transcriptional regulator [Bradyrhizobium jicamae]MBR0801612.1 LysR family transcriptional regulator [Bradyrhizobium jicamae]
MDTRFLQSLVTVIECGSIAEAARRLNLTPAGVTQRIRTLETDFGARLLSRSGRVMQPTPAGTAILERARSLINEVQDLKAIASSDELSGELRIGVMQTSLSGLFAGALIPFTRTYPRVDVRIVRGTSSGLYEKLMGGEIDAAITSQPPFAIPKTCEWHVLREEPFVVLTSASLKLRDAHAVLASEPFIRLDRSVFAGRLIDDYLRKVGIRPKDRYELDGLELIAVMVDRGLGVSLLPDWAPPWPEGLSLRKLALPDRSFVRRTGLLWNRASHRTRLAQAFYELAEVTVGLKAPKARSRAR